MIQKIKDLVVGTTVSVDLVVKSSEIKLTSAKKPYLFLELFDGSDTIYGNKWDWTSTAKPEKNTVLTVDCQVTEWSGKKQLKINSITINLELDLSAFAPQGDVDIAAYIAEVKRLTDEIQNDECRELVIAAFSDNSKLWKTVPGAKSVHHAFVAGTLKHSVDVAKKAKALGELSPLCNLDLCIAGGLLHDFGKLWTYQLDGVAIDMTDNGNLLDHICIGIAKMESYRTPENSKVLDLLQHIIASHHGKLEHGSPVTPRFLEAWLVNYADGADAKAQVIFELNSKASVDAKYTDKEWTLENRPMLTQYYIADVMGE